MRLKHSFLPSSFYLTHIENLLCLRHCQILGYLSKQNPQVLSWGGKEAECYYSYSFIYLFVQQIFIENGLQWLAKKNLAFMDFHLGKTDVH